MLEAKSAAERDSLYGKCLTRWKSEDEVTSREMRKVLRRKMTSLSLDHLAQVKHGRRRPRGRFNLSFAR